MNMESEHQTRLYAQRLNFNPHAMGEKKKEREREKLKTADFMGGILGSNQMCQAFITFRRSP